MQRALLRRLSALCALTLAPAFLSTCGSSSTGPAVQLTVTVTPNVTNALPGQTVVGTIQVTTNTSATIDSVGVVATGVVASHQTFVDGHRGTFTITPPFEVPSSVGTGSLTITATAHAGSSAGTGQAVIGVSDTTHPAITLGIAPQQTIFAPGDSLVLTVTATDPGALTYAVVKVSGAFSAVDSSDAHDVQSYVHAIHLKVPNTAHIQTLVHIAATAANVGGVVTSDSMASITVADTAHPTVVGSLTTTHAGAGAAPGDTLTMSVHATDRKLAYVGYTFGPPANVSDSVATSAQTYDLSARIGVASGWAGSSPYAVFARDSVGNRTQVAAGVLTVASRTRRPIVSATSPGGVRDAVFDAKRKLVYLSVPDLLSVQVLSTASMTFGAPYQFGASPHGLDLTPGGDSLVVALVQTPNVAIINLNTGAQTTMPVTTGSGPDFLRVSNTNKVLVTITFAGSGYGGSFIEADLATGATRNLKTVTEYVPLAASGNRSRIMALIDDSCCPEEAFVYDAASGSIVADAGTISNYFNWVTSDYLGDAYLIQSLLYGPTLRQTSAYVGHIYNGGPSVLAPDGQTGYFADSTGFVHARFSDGKVLDTFDLGEPPAGMWLSNDGVTMVVAGTSHVFLVDLW